MKNKLKKLGVLAVVLANVAIFTPQKVEGQRTVVIDNMDGSSPTSEYRRTDYHIFGTHYILCSGTGVGCIYTITVNG